MEVKEYSEALSMLTNEDVADKKHSTTSRTFQNLDQDSLLNLFNVPEEECGSVSYILFNNENPACNFHYLF